MMILHYIARSLIVFMIIFGYGLSVYLVIIRLKELKRLRAELRNRQNSPDSAISVQIRSTHHNQTSKFPH